MQFKNFVFNVSEMNNEANLSTHVDDASKKTENMIWGLIGAFVGETPCNGEVSCEIKDRDNGPAAAQNMADDIALESVGSWDDDQNEDIEENMASQNKLEHSHKDIEETNVKIKAVDEMVNKNSDQPVLDISSRNMSVYEVSVKSDGSWDSCQAEHGEDGNISVGSTGSWDSKHSGNS